MARDSRSIRPDATGDLARFLMAASNPPDLAMWGEVLADNITLRIGNRPSKIDRTDALAELGWMFAHVRSLGQGFREIWPGTDGQTMFMELDVALLDGGTPLPLAIVLRAAASKAIVLDIRFYLDPAPLTAEAPMLGRLGNDPGSKEGS